MSFDRPYVVSWNLTYRCNLACEHCYLDAGGAAQVQSEAFSDRSELGTQECYRVVDQLAAFAPECLTILTGGEPLLRRDILEIAGYAAGKGLWVVVGTNGVRGMALSLDALDAARHDAFRRVRGAFQNTVEGARILREAGLPFIVQTTVGRHNLAELPALAEFAQADLGAGVLEFSTKSVVLQKEMAEDQASFKKNGNFIEVLMAFSYSKEAKEKKTSQKEVVPDLMLRLVNDIVERNQGMIKFKLDETKGKMSISLISPVERRKVLHYD